MSTNQQFIHFFVADGLKKVVTHKPASLCFTIVNNGNLKIYTVPTKISASKIKRRCNRKIELNCAWVDCAGTDTVYTSPGHAHGKDVISIQPDQNVHPENLGFLFYVETKGGKTEGRQKQRYLLLKRDAHYVIRGIVGSVINVHLKTRTGDILYLSNSTNQQSVFPSTSLTRPVLSPSSESIVVPVSTPSSSGEDTESDSDASPKRFRDPEYFDSPQTKRRKLETLLPFLDPITWDQTEQHPSSWEQKDFLMSSQSEPLPFQVPRKIPSMWIQTEPDVNFPSLILPDDTSISPVGMERVFSFKENDFLTDDSSTSLWPNVDKIPSSIATEFGLPTPPSCLSHAALKSPLGDSDCMGLK